MGKVMVKKITGLSVMAKVSLVLVWTILLSVIMYEGWYKPHQSDAAVSIQQAWTSLYSNTAFPTGPYAYTVNAGPNRTLVVGVSTTISSANATQTCAVTFGGQAMSPVAGNNATSALQHTYLFYLNDTGIKAATSSNIVVAMGGTTGTSTYSSLYAAVYNGTDQSAFTGGLYNGGTAQSSAVGPISPSLVLAAGDMAADIINITRTGSTSARTISTWATNWSSAVSNISNTANAVANYIGVNSTAGTTTSQHTASSSAMRAMSGLVVKAATTGVPVITSVSPTGVNADGSTNTVTINGTGLTGTTSVLISGTLVTPGIITVVDDTQITVPVTATSAAIPGARNITVVNGVATSVPFTATGFVISSNPPPTVTSISPVVLGQGGTAQSVVITGANFVSGTGLAANFGTGVTVNSTTWNSTTQLTANITVTTSATAGAHNVIVTNPDTQTGTGTGLLTVNSRATVTSTLPLIGAQGATNLDVTINGTNFVSGTTLAAVFSGTGITVNSTTFVDATHLTANVTIAAAAAVGSRTITVTNGDTGVSSASGSFTLYDPTKINISSVSPSTIGQGASNVLFNIYGANFVSGATVTFSSSRFEAQTGSTTFVDAGHLTVLVNTTTSSVQSSNVTVTNPDLTNFALASAVATIARPTITSIAPSSLLQGTGTDIVITGTGFQAGATVAFPVASSGITLSNVIVASATSITAHVDTTATATLGIQTVTIANPDFGFNTSTFNVFSATAPTLTSMTPATLGQAATINVDVYGTNFSANMASAVALTATANLGFGSGITTNSVTFVDSTHLQANITLSTSATAGAHVVTVTNPTSLEAGTASILTVTARPGTTSILPVSGTPGQTLDIAIASTGLLDGPGFGVSFTSIPVVTNGSTVSSGITVNSAPFSTTTSVTANVTISSDYLVAPIGARLLNLSNGDYGLRTATFTVLGVQPTLTSASPAMRQGATAQDLTIVGTNFYPNSVVTFSDANVTLNSMTFVDQNTIKVNISVGGVTTVGVSNITVTNADTKSVTGTGLLSIVAGPTITSNTPASAGQGESATVTISGTNFDAITATSGVAFSGAGITVNSVVPVSGTQLTANVSVAADAVMTNRFITVTNLDGSSASGGSFTVTAPNSTTPGPLSFYQVTADSITVKASYLNDGNNAGTCEIKYGTASGVFPNTLVAVRSGSSFVATATGLAGGADGAGKKYYFQATFSNTFGVTGNPVVLGSQSTAGSPLVHNNLNTNSVQWTQGWGLTDGKYGDINCATCHSKTTGNRKLVSGVFNATTGTWDSTGNSSLTVIYDNATQLGSDDNHGTSTKACEACHTKTNHHRYNNVAANHEGTVDCITCHSHKEAFVPNCSVCHSTAQGTRRAITGQGGDFFTSKSSAHGTLTGTNSQACSVCHANSTHKGGVVALKNADTGVTVAFDKTVATAADLKTVCLSCHDANGATVYGTNALSPFAAAGDIKSPTNITQYWAATGGAHDTKMVCMNCHGNSQATTDALKYNIHASGKKKILQDAGYNVVNPNNYCFNCHNSASTDPNKSSKNIFGEFALANKHTTAKCFDCHGDENNSLDSMHSLRAGTQTAGSGVIATNLSNATGRSMTWSTSKWSGASAVSTLASNTVTSEYQICFKCHAALGTGITPEINNTSAPYTAGTAGALTNLALEFNPNNASGHPVVTGLNNYPNSAAPKALTAGKMKAPWNVNLGTQVMTCSDCHATDSAASKGPHGSSVKWMLAGTNKAWPYTAAASNGTSSGTLFRVATYATGNGTKDGLFCLNCHTVTASNNWHSNGDVTGGQHGSNAIMACASCHIRVPHGGKISRLLQTTNAPGRYRSSGSTATSSFDFWGSTASRIKGSTFSSSNFNSSCNQHNSGGVGGEAW